MFGRPHFPYSLQTRRSRRHHGKPEYHRNIPSAFFGLVVAGLFAVTIAEPNWFHLDGGLCTGRHVGLYTIFGADDQHLKGIKLVMRSKLLLSKISSYKSVPQEKNNIYFYSVFDILAAESE